VFTYRNPFPLPVWGISSIFIWGKIFKFIAKGRIMRKRKDKRGKLKGKGK
jgi:hypothetical protein